jgi:SAM-dependent methyltransferase
MNDRSRFGARQAEMTARWFENVKAAHGNVDAYILTRQKAYMGRWNEAGRFIEDGSTILDIGGGNLFLELLAYFVERRFRYSYLDIDPAAVDGSRTLAQQAGMIETSFAVGFNDRLDFPDSSFDAIFSSHCIEHSIDLATTMRELNRVLKPGGNLLMAVPFGWEANPEHPYFLGPDEWISLVEDGGFRITIAQIGNEYPEIGEDYFIAATKVAEPLSPTRVDPPAFMKENYQFIESSAPSLSYKNAFDFRSDAAISASPESSVILTPPPGAMEILPILHRHAWSGSVRLSDGVSWHDCDLYSWFAYDMPVRIVLTPNQADPLTISLIGKSPASRWSQFVIKGYLWR